MKSIHSGGLVVAVVLAFLAGPIDAPHAAAPVVQQSLAPDRQRRALNARVFDAAAREVQRRFVDADFNGLNWRVAVAEARPSALAAEDEASLYGAIETLLERLEDRHVYALPPSLLAIVDPATPRRAGLDMQVLGVGARFQVMRVDVGGVADAAGVQEGWWIASMDGGPVSPRTIVGLAPGQAVDMVFVDDAGERHRRTLVAGDYRARPGRWTDRPAPGVLRIGLDRIDDGAAAWVAEALEGLTPDDALILDFRGNRGGDVGETRRMLGCFLPVDHILFEATPRRGPAYRHRVEGDCVRFEGPMVVIVDRFSSSGAELSALVLTEAGRAVVVGERTEGAGRLARQYALPDGGQVSVSIGDLRTPAGSTVERTGFTPSISARQTLDDRRQGRDPALEAALAVFAP